MCTACDRHEFRCIRNQKTRTAFQAVATLLAARSCSVIAAAVASAAAAAAAAAALLRLFSNDYFEPRERTTKRK